MPNLLRISPKEPDQHGGKIGYAIDRAKQQLVVYQESKPGSGVYNMLHRVGIIVGKPEKKTPLFKGKEVNFMRARTTWGVPDFLVKDINRKVTVLDKNDKPVLDKSGEPVKKMMNIAAMKLAQLKEAGFSMTKNKDGKKEFTQLPSPLGALGPLAFGTDGGNGQVLHGTREENQHLFKLDDGKREISSGCGRIPKEELLKAAAYALDVKNPEVAKLLQQHKLGSTHTDVVKLLGKLTEVSKDGKSFVHAGYQDFGDKLREDFKLTVATHLEYGADGTVRIPKPEQKKADAVGTPKPAHDTTADTQGKKVVRPRTNDIGAPAA